MDYIFNIIQFFYSLTVKINLHNNRKYSHIHIRSNYCRRKFKVVNQDQHNIF